MLLLSVSFLFGLLLGSFANVCVVRLPEGDSIVSPRSRCPHCGASIRFWDNIPILSFLLLAGRCRACRAAISWQYPCIELTVAIFFTFHAVWFGPDLSRAVILDLLFFYLFVISIIDYRHRIIPDELSLSLIALGLVISWANPLLQGPPLYRLAESAAAALMGGASMFFLAWLGEKIFKQEALGGGDIKLVAAFGAVLGWQRLWTSLFVGSMLGALAGIALILMKKKKRRETLPFGPFLSLGAYLACFLP